MNRFTRAKTWLLALSLPLVAVPSLANEMTIGPVLATSALHTDLAAQAVLLDLARAGTRLVAVGERGTVVLSDDNGNSWRQADVPVSVGLTAVQFVDAKQGWAVGHAGVVLATVDGGDHWSVQLDGVRAAKIELQSAQQALASAADAETAQVRVDAAQRLVDDGPDKPFLALDFVDAKRGVIVGAYGLAMQTHDGGASWQSLMGQIDNPMGMHLYGVAHQGQRWFLAGEQGYLARSDDDAQVFTALESPYEGSFFTLQMMGNDEVLVAGLKGKAFLSSDAGETFAAAPIIAPVSFSDSIRLADGQVLLVNQAGGIFRSSASSANLQPVGKPLGRPVASLIQAADGALVVAGFTGLMRISPTASSVSE